MAGGRANRKGLAALYLSLDEMTALGEYRQGGTILPPGTLVSYVLSLDRVVDFTGGLDDSWPPLWQEFYCDWRNLYFAQDIEPPSWVIGDLVMADGCSGILFKSAANPPGTNLVVYTDQIPEHGTIMVNDPHQDLPKDQSSWIRP
ncbi:hypothetical protein PS691_01958 [Pseudomonas fluorescens]|uniref:RES domain-containing protein n=2 Tax=Pseudomonas fluorescens TaxID=294 RepID=A0A5E7BRD4_PSEFL|nr:hypothetical protein PS691_01958 [Pseudomonas fluorescens]